MKRLFLLVTILAAGIVTQAQIAIGVKAGVNFSKFGGAGSDFGSASPKYLTGFVGGAFVHIPIAESFSVQPELLYSMEGSKYAEGGDKLLYKLNFIDIPVLIQYNASGFYGETGPQIGFLTSAKLTDGSASEDVKSELNSTNFSWAVGLGYKMTNGFGIGARYNIGLSDLNKDSGGSDKVTDGGFNIHLSYTFKMAHRK